MINKRDFLRTGGVAIVTSAGAATTLAAVRPRLDAAAGLASWQAHVGQRFEVDGHAVTLVAASPLPGRQPGEQFSLRFAGAVPSDVGDAVHTLSLDGSACIALHLARTPQGLRADFCRLQG